MGLTLITSDVEKNSNEKADLPVLEMKRLTTQCSRAAFSCGDKDIDKWFQRSAQKHHDSMDCRVMTGHLVNNSNPVGFYATAMKLQPVSSLPKEYRNRLRWDGGSLFPVMHLRYVGVIKSLQRKGFGRVLMGSALDDFYEVATRTGIFALTLVAVDRKTAEFYQKLGFLPFGDLNASQPSLLLPAAAVIDLRDSL
jgi:hypothetical protein